MEDERIVPALVSVYKDTIANADPSVFSLNNFYLFIAKVCIWWCIWSGVHMHMVHLLMTPFLKIYPIPKIRNIPIYRLAYSIAIYRIAVSWYVSYRKILANTQPYYQC